MNRGDTCTMTLNKTASFDFICTEKDLKINRNTLELIAERNTKPAYTLVGF